MESLARLISDVLADIKMADYLIMLPTSWADNQSESIVKLSK
jgi:hypothetical protein